MMSCEINQLSLIDPSTIMLRQALKVIDVKPICNGLVRFIKVTGGGGERGGQFANSCICILIIHRSLYGCL